MNTNVQSDFQKSLNFIKKKEYKNALEILINLKKKDSRNPNVLFYLGLIYAETNNIKKSIFFYEQLLKDQPNSLNALYSLAGVKQFLGEINPAKEIYLKLKELDKDSVKPFYGLFTLDPKYLSEKDYETIIDIREKKMPSLHDFGVINFLLSKKEKQKKNIRNELELLKSFHTSVFDSKYQYNMSARFYYNQIINKHYDKIKFINNYESNSKSDLMPIFIVGLPRSGSTLIESILKSSEENIKSLGECNIINASLLEQIGPKIYNKDFNIKNFQFEIDKDEFEKRVLFRYSQVNIGDNPKITFIDKSLENIFNVEIIINLFPNAKFLYTHRNPYDSFFSIYQSMLPELAWTNSIKDILDYMDSSMMAINYFKKKYSQNILEINLEEFSQSAEQFTKKIYDFCNLTWNNKSLEFYKRKDLFTKTLSFSQVRSPVTSYNSDKYKDYYYLINDYKNNYDWLK